MVPCRVNVNLTLQKGGRKGKSDTHLRVSKTSLRRASGNLTDNGTLGKGSVLGGRNKSYS